MATQRLTDKTILAARAEPGRRLEIWDEKTPGLCLRVSATSLKNSLAVKQTKVWVWRYRTIDGRQPRLKLADYSDQHGLSWAREEVEELRVQVRKGGDPAGLKRIEKAKAQSEPIQTFDDLADAFIEACQKGHWKPRKKQKRLRTIADEIAILRRYIRPAIGTQRIEAIDRRMVRQIFNDMLDRGIGAQTNRTLAVLRQVLAYGVDLERIAANPAAGLDKPATESPRSRVMNDQELKSLWQICAECPAELRAPARFGETSGRRLYVTRRLRIALQLTILLLSRRNEIAGMAVSELDLEQGVWLIPAERMKGGLPHLLPLTQGAIALITEAMALAKATCGGRAVNHVFPSPRDRDTPMKPDAITHAMADLCAVLAIANASPHDLRRTGSTLMTSERLGITPFIRSKILSHSGDAGGGASVSMIHYDTNSYVADKRVALMRWEELLHIIVEANPLESKAIAGVDHA